MRKTLFLTLLLAGMMTFQRCSTPTATVENPFFTPWTTPFGVPPFDKIKPEHFKPAIEAGIAQQNAQIDSIVNNPQPPTFANVILAMEKSGELLTTAYTAFSLINAADSNEQLQEIDQQVSPMVSSHNDKIFLNEELFKKVKAVHQSADTSTLDAQSLRLCEKIYKQFVRSGALLDPTAKSVLRGINDSLSLLGVQFGNNLLAANKGFTMVLDSVSDLAGLPEGSRTAAANLAASRGMEGKWAFTLSKPSLIPFITYSERGDLREKMYRGYLERCKAADSTNNTQIINEMVRLRLEKARLMGYPSYAAFVLDDVMAKTPENVYQLIDKMWKPALELSKQELSQMQAIKQTETGSTAFESWDWWYYAEKVRKQKYDLNEEMLRPYFSLECVTSGIFQLSNRLWGITFRPVALPVYNNECSAYEVLDRDNSHLGILYLDFFPRDGKQGGAWCGAYREQTYNDDKRVAPVVTIVCNFTRPNGSTPALLSLDETETFFHEFGHALHSLFSDVKYRGIGSVERDFVELPSQIMENWAFEPQVLNMYAKHYATNQPIPEELIAKIQRSSLFNQGFLNMENLAASLIDMDIHSITTYDSFDVNAFMSASLTKHGLIKEIEPRYRFPYFSHIFNGGYSAGYYSYKWAEVLDADAYAAFVESGDIFNSKLAKAYRQEILSKGGSQDGMQLYQNFRGSTPDITPLLRKRGLIPAETETEQIVRQ